ncbi:hypothetical protein HD806DRAFT_542715 [Xylariaceae sp. AK1471]|nr:hypothetical protein HD806DRAFT_542715 [Xylariaceae sp. AK1471]
MDSHGGTAPHATHAFKEKGHQRPSILDAIYNYEDYNNEHLNIIRELLVEYRKKDAEKSTACLEGHYFEVSEGYLRGYLPPLHLAAAKGNLEVVKLLAGQRDQRDGSKDVRCSIYVYQKNMYFEETGQPQRGEDHRIKDRVAEPEGKTPQVNPFQGHFSCKQYHNANGIRCSTPLDIAIETRNESVAQYLIEKNAEIWDEADEDGQRRAIALNQACFYNLVDTVKCLFKYHSNSFTDEIKTQALNQIFVDESRGTGGDIDIAEYLARGYNVHINGETRTTANKLRLILFLLQEEARPSAETKEKILELVQQPQQEDAEAFLIFLKLTLDPL